VQLNSDQCSFFFLFLGASLRFFCTTLCLLNLFFAFVLAPFYWGFLPLLLARFFWFFVGSKGGIAGAFLACFWLPLGNLGSGILAIALPPHFFVFLALLGMGWLRRLLGFGVFEASFRGKALKCPF
jgi:hypothetical protein